nr:MAG TPA: hypothetical protein [Caudoviricetes sp.]
MPWKEFSALLSGLAPETPLGRVVAIRAETNKEVIKNFTPEQKKINKEYQRRIANGMSKEKYKREMERLEKEIARMFQ